MEVHGAQRRTTLLRTSRGTALAARQGSDLCPAHHAHWQRVCSQLMVQRQRAATQVLSCFHRHGNYFPACELAPAPGCSPTPRCLPYAFTYVGVQHLLALEGHFCPYLQEAWLTQRVSQAPITPARGRQALTHPGLCLSAYSHHCPLG